MCMHLVHRFSFFSSEHTLFACFVVGSMASSDRFFVVFSEKPVEQVHDSFLKADAIAPFCKGSNDPLLGIRLHENADR